MIGEGVGKFWRELFILKIQSSVYIGGAYNILFAQNKFTNSYRTILIILIFLYRRVFVEQFGDRDGRVTSPHGLRQLHDIAVRHMGSLEAGHAVDAVRMV